ncbi:TRAP transporter substrate-binding protein [Sansalvadorimonas sp. 2012CJ34-2]|uniref:TRAP transporter substrate-binding protein n=1 Tax=Parendozoicomonas callyspongiae TaxID=2942213 RepID=A0ABT0PI41_9GAMM|nr:TRAP transporter substrate-binding protein [Sansalvadorimonas sp. 2012CJ34-2]MCL6270427.1 TRAP transporter substrate-binding protein [Sansalvadorimonas sp. 2012CJ34-2]
MQPDVLGMLRHIALQITTAMLCLLMAGVANSELSSQPKPKVLKLAHNLPLTHSVHLAFVYLADQLQDVSNGQLILRLYPSSQMGDAIDTLQMLQIGALDLSKGTSSDLEPFESAYSLFNLPFLFQDEVHFDAVLKGVVGQRIMNKTRDRGFFCIASYVAGYRSFYARKPVKTPDDLKGMKIRVQVSPISLKMIRLMGGAPTPMPFGEVYTALQQGVVDAAENNEASWVNTRHFEVTRFFSETRHLSQPDFLVISTRVWDQLNEQQRQWLQEAVARSESFQRKQWQELTSTSRNIATQSGAEIIPVDRRAFRDAVTPLYEQFQENKEHKELLELILAAKGNS